MSASPNARNQGSGRDPQLKPGRTLLIRPGAIGDVIVSLPALQFCRTEYTEVWTSTAVVPLIRFADHVRSIASTGLDLLELGVDDRARRLLESFDSIVSWYGSSRPEFRDAVRDFPFVFHTALPTDHAGCHATDFYMRQVGGPDGAVPRVGVGDVVRRNFIAVHPFSGSAQKNWPLEKFRQLASLLPCPVEFCAGPEEMLEGALRFNSLYEVAQWMAEARAYVGNDSGITHLAAAVGTPVIAIFRATDPAVWAPRGDVRVMVGDPTAGEVRDAIVRRTGG